MAIALATWRQRDSFHDDEVPITWRQKAGPDVSAATWEP